MGIDEVYKNKIGKELTLKLAEVMQKEEVDEEEAKNIAGFILDGMKDLQTKEQILQFLLEVSQKWPFFLSILTIEKGSIQETQEDQKTAEVEALIKENKLNEALEKAKIVTGGGS